MQGLANHKIGQTSTLPDDISQIYVICDVVKPEILCLTTLKFAFHTLKAERQILGSLLIDSLLYSVIGISLTYRRRIVSYFTMMRCVAILSGMISFRSNKLEIISKLKTRSHYISSLIGL